MAISVIQSRKERSFVIYGAFIAFKPSLNVFLPFHLQDNSRCVVRVEGISPGHLHQAHPWPSGIMSLLMRLVGVRGH